MTLFFRKCLSLCLVTPLLAFVPGPLRAADPLAPPPIPGDASSALPAPLPGDVPLPSDAAPPAAPADLAVPQAASPAASAPAAAPAPPQADLPLAYKGLRLGMSMAALRAFVDGQPRMYADATDSLNGVTRVTLHEEAPGRQGSQRPRPADPSAFFTLGCASAGCYGIQSATVAFLDDKAVSFTLRNQWSMKEAQADPGLKGWLEFVQAAFSKKYGKPAAVSLAPGQADFEDFQDLWNAAPFVQWNSGGSKVLLELTRSGEFCRAAVEVQDNAGAERLLRKGLAGK
jgi:hypothetical protein